MISENVCGQDSERASSPRAMLFGIAGTGGDVGRRCVCMRGVGT